MGWALFDQTPLSPKPKISTGTGDQGHVARCLSSSVHDKRSLFWLPNHMATSFATLLTVIRFPVYNIWGTDPGSLTCQSGSQHVCA